MYIMINQKSEKIVMEHIYNENMIYGHERNNHELDAYEEQAAVVKILLSLSNIGNIHRENL